MRNGQGGKRKMISTHAPAGGATYADIVDAIHVVQFLLTPLREGRLHQEYLQDRDG